MIKCSTRYFFLEEEAIHRLNPAMDVALIASRMRRGYAQSKRKTRLRFSLRCLGPNEEDLQRGQRCCQGD